MAENLGTMLLQNSAKCGVVFNQCNGKPRYSQSHGSVEPANKDIEDMLKMWL